MLVEVAVAVLLFSIVKLIIASVSTSTRHIQVNFQVFRLIYSIKLFFVRLHFQLKNSVCKSDVDYYVGPRLLEMDRLGTNLCNPGI